MSNSISQEELIETARKEQNLYNLYESTLSKLLENKAQQSGSRSQYFLVLSALSILATKQDRVVDRMCDSFNIDRMKEFYKVHKCGKS